ncbi:MAG: NAD(P)-dependent oxidoreductase [Ferruginibacter sp.]|nr:NAD(P)-dependent oxidoreductase [Ferruginibacter sp.]
MKKILVTGATGFIGQYVMDQLLQQNYSVIASSSSVENASKASWFPRVKYIPFNLREFDNSINYYNYFDKPEAIIHLAWQGLPNYNAAFHVEENLPLHYSFLKNCMERGLRDITITGTCFEYGMQEGCLSEEMETKPANAYATAKDALRKQLALLQQENNFQLKWIRLFYMYGKGQSPNSLLSQVDKALANGEKVFNMSGGEQQRDYLPVEKVAEYIIAIAAQNKVSGVINCCSGKPISVKELVQNYLLQKMQHIQLNLGYYPYTDYEPMRFWGNNQKLKSIN